MAQETITDIDAITGEAVTRPATEEEIAQHAALKAERAEEEAAKAAIAAKKQEVLEKLGLTPDEVIALLA